ncbi:GNAT family N-acetyltransferase [Veronia pacifica]|uniref:Acetyltransferase n=1 Tax=Veronia pacifica TaxID=1080227 RepID=A0A1C3ELE2_9GAMM|nr:GNAT family N-acetyltransferase [Veronia pacifica]ODA34052.1 acetyltransferase [Veronia pacifica]
MEYQITKATLEDAEHIAQLFDAYRVFYQQESDVRLAESFIFERLKNYESVIFVARSINGEWLGFTQLYPSFSSVSAHRIWILNDLFVAETARRLGVGKQLMNAAKHFANETGAMGIALETAEDNHSAQALYESLGYQQTGGVYHYFLTL